MNLLVGAVCEDGVVVGSGGSGTAWAGGGDHLEQRAVNTLVVRGDMILAGTGRAGLAERFVEVACAVRSDSRFHDWTGLSIAKMISAEVIDDFASTRCDRGQFGALVAFCACDGFHLCQFAASDFQPELRTAETWLAALGTGRPVAEPFLAFLQRAFFADTPVKLHEGIFGATWALDYALGLGSRTGPGAVEIAVLAQENADLSPAARLLVAEELSESLAKVRAAERHVAGYRQSLPDGRG